MELIYLYLNLESRICRSILNVIPSLSKKMLSNSYIINNKEYLFVKNYFYVIYACKYLFYPTNY